MDVRVLIGAANAALARKDWLAAVDALEQVRSLLNASDFAPLERALISALANASGGLLNQDSERALQLARRSETLLNASPNANETTRNLLDFNLAAAEIANRDFSAGIARYAALCARSPTDVQAAALYQRALLSASRDLELNNQTEASLALAKRITGVPGVLRQLILPWVYRSHAHLQSARAEFEAKINQLPNIIAGSLDELSHDHFVLAYQGQNDVELASRYGDWLCRQSARFQPLRSPTVGGRIALVSSFWRECTVGSYFSAWLFALRDAGFAVEVYQLGPQHDAQTQDWLKRVGAGQVLQGRLHEHAQMLASRGIDLLIYPELGMDGRSLALASLRLARLQWCAWGHPVTTGLPTIDRFISCEAMEPNDASSHYREPLLLLPGLGTAYAQAVWQAPKLARGVLKQAHGLPAGICIFLPQSPFKITPDHDEVMVAFAREFPDANWMLFEAAKSGLTHALQDRLRACFAAAGCDPQRLHWLPMCPRQTFLEIASCCDFALDTFGFSGGNTSIDCLSVGLPVLTRESAHMRGRQTAAMLRAVDAQSLIAKDVEGQIQCAKRVLSDAEFRGDLQKRIAHHLPGYLRSENALAELISQVRLALAQ